MARTMIQTRNGNPAGDARKRAAILERIERRESRDIADMLRHIAGTDSATIRQEWSR